MTECKFHEKFEDRIEKCENRLEIGDNRFKIIENNQQVILDSLALISDKIEKNGKSPDIIIHTTFINEEGIEKIKLGWIKFKKWVVAFSIGAGISAGGVISWLSGIFN